MSAGGPQPTCSAMIAMTAVGPRADIRSDAIDVRF